MLSANGYELVPTLSLFFTCFVTGLEWDAPPEMKMKIDRPYIFFVRWRNVSLMNGNFVL